MNPKITILATPETRQITTAKGATKNIHSQKASVETESMRMQIDIELDNPNQPFAIGQVLEWDVAADLVPGQYGRLELARRKSLRPWVETKKLAAA